MLNFIIQNAATIIISLILLVITLAIITSMIKKKKKGISSCGCDCDKCGGSCSAEMKLHKK